MTAKEKTNQQTATSAQRHCPGCNHGASDAIRKRAPVAQQDPALQKATAQKLRQTITRLPKQPAFIEARRRCAEALSKLDEPTNMSFGQQLLESPEPDLRASPAPSPRPSAGTP